MSYQNVPLRGLGEIDVWERMWAHTLNSDEVYVLRLQCANLPLKDGADLLLFARAAGQSQNLSLDVRSVGAWQSGADPGDWTIDVVMTAAGFAGNWPVFTTDADDMKKSVASDEELKLAFPKFEIRKATFGRLTAPKDAIDTWRAQPILWDHSLEGRKKRGGPTQTFATPVALTTFRGKADDGRKAETWPVTSAKKKTRMAATGATTSSEALW